VTNGYILYAGGSSEQPTGVTIMSLDVVGAGFGRTGTLSLKLALEKLGFAQTYHMAELFQNPDHLDLWEEALQTGSCDWDSLFQGYRASVDWPACTYWKELADYYPDSKVILSLRDPDSWFKSVHNTIYPTSMEAMKSEDPHLQRWANWGNQLIWQNTFDGRVEDKDHAIATFNANSEAVRNTIEADRLLVFEAAQGWEPLCRFLECDVPNEPYPRVNTTEEFTNRE
jgi:hypothetical protein